MASKKDAEVRVQVAFAYAHLKSGEVKQFVKDDLIDPDTIKPESLDHLKSIGFVG